MGCLKIWNHGPIVYPQELHSEIAIGGSSYPARSTSRPMLIHIDLPQSDRSTIDQPSPRGPKNCGSEGHFAAQKFGTLIQSHCLYLLICWIIKFYPLKLPVENMRTSNLTHQNCQWKSSRSGLANSNCHAFQNIIFYQLKSSKILEQVQPIEIAMKFWNIKFYPSHSWNSLTSILPIEIAIKKDET
jgi:hypothetical protein